ncbi:sigma-70 family RNA polymerase sigma factor [Allorhizobium taibaishanense]|uniref:RNA polymerase sigma-70 factor (ECF subfamily) n=1 Tax=Allorhizobium taibaishanense TaxID=887144 RepID=A0A1Q9A6M2_9HYPH|nr:sigma-70 family RNA polymerase sigma factor [Allorhizobium taibaishanense]MBB4008646.1 RNA polymerase sigma-70 factor (ECF subfamily) [Allorhizobium taibaishanense]OLP50219.1 RNA polymerase subunit sigma [Allorhizobium taibaishanense]
MPAANNNNTSVEIVSLIPALRAFAHSFCKTPEDVDDLVQETLTRALANVDKFDPGTKLKSWLFTIMRNTFCTRFRKRQREVVGIEPGFLDTLSVGPTQEWTTRAVEVREALSRLPTHQREIIILVVMLGESYETAAEVSGCAVGTVKSRLNRARQRLFQELGEETAQEIL